MLGRYALLSELGNGLADRLVDGLRVSIRRPLAQRRNPVGFLGQIDQVEVDRKGHGHRPGVPRIQGGHFRLQPRGGRRLAGAPAASAPVFGAPVFGAPLFGQAPNALFRLKQGG